MTKLILTDDNTSIASGCYGDYIIIRKIHERTKEVIVQYKGSSFNALEISNDNKFIISTFHEKMRILNLQENSEKILLRNPADTLTCAAVTSDSKYIAFGCRQNVDYFSLSHTTIRVWDFQKKKK